MAYLRKISWLKVITILNLFTLFIVFPFLYILLSNTRISHPLGIHSERVNLKMVQENLNMESAVSCEDKDLKPRILHRSNFWVLLNYIPARKRFHCWESITFTTHCDYTFMDNLEPLLLRWQGPVSVSIYAPGRDFAPTLKSIRWARTCMGPLIEDLVTFHIYFDEEHVPEIVPKSSEALSDLTLDCSVFPPWTNVTSMQLYKNKHYLLYPVNVGRNIAREAAATHFVLAADIELYPSPGLIHDFLEMIQRKELPLHRQAPRVFPLPIFELQAGSSLPKNKEELVNMLKNNVSIPFHKNICASCHQIPRAKAWVNAKVYDGLHVFQISYRWGIFSHWEPIYIGTNDEPPYHETLSWEGRYDKMTQGYIMCVLGYEFHILDNAFLVHKPGIKTLEINEDRNVEVNKTNKYIHEVVLPSLKILYGNPRRCIL